MIYPAKRPWDMFFVSSGEYNWYKFGVGARSLIELLSDEPSLPHYSKPVTRLFFDLESAAKSLRTDEQDEVRALNLPRRPARPTLSWCGLVLIHFCVDPILTQAIAELAHALHMRLRIMAIADEYLWRPGAERTFHCESPSQAANILHYTPRQRWL